MSNEIDITDTDHIKVVKEVYNLSSPQGLGFLHYQDGDELTDEEAQEILSDSKKFGMAINMDYVKGRSCKFRAFERDGRVIIFDQWFDHSKTQLQELLNRIGLETQND